MKMKRFLIFLCAVVFVLSCTSAAMACTEYCGMELPAFRTGTPSEIELRDAAIQRVSRDGNKIIGKDAVVHHFGSLYSSANGYSDIVGQAYHDDEYLIIGYSFVNGTAWLNVMYGSTPAWISTRLVEITGEHAEEGNNPYADQYKGKTCIITANSARARMSADKNSPIVEYVHYGEAYVIRSTASAPDNTLWFQISVDGNLCWISSGLARTN